MTIGLHSTTSSLQSTGLTLSRTPDDNEGPFLRTLSDCKQSELPSYTFHHPVMGHDRLKTV